MLEKPAKSDAVRSLDGRLDTVGIKSMTRLRRDCLDTYVYMNRLQELSAGLFFVKAQVTRDPPAIC